MKLEKDKIYYLAICTIGSAPEIAGVQEFVYDDNLKRNIDYNTRMGINYGVNLSKNEHLSGIEFSSADLNENALNTTFEKYGYYLAICDDKEKAYRRFRAMLSKSKATAEQEAEEIQKKFKEKLQLINFFNRVDKLRKDVM